MSTAFSVSLVCKTSDDRQRIITGSRNAGGNYLWSGSFSPILNNAGLWWSGIGGTPPTIEGILNRWGSIFSSAGTLTKYRQKVDEAPYPSDASKYFTLETNVFDTTYGGGATTLDFHIIGTATQNDSGAKTVAITAGYLATIYLGTNTGLLINWPHMGHHTLDFIPTVAGSRCYDCTMNVTNGVTKYHNGVGTVHTGDSDTTEQFTVIPTSGTIKNLYVNTTNVAPGAGKTLTITVRKNGVDTALTVSVVDANKLGSNTVNSFAVVEGDLISIKGTVDDPVFGNLGLKIGWTFVAADITETPIFLSQWGVAAVNDDANFWPVSGSVNTTSGTWTPSTNQNEDYCKQACYDCTISKMVVRIDEAPGFGMQRVFTVRKNGVDTGLAVTIQSLETTGVLETDVVFTSAIFDHISLQEVIEEIPEGEPETIDIVCGTVGVVTNTVTDIDHLEGNTVAILADGEVLEQQVVQGGQIELIDSYSKIIIGLPFVSDLETLNIEVPMRDGTMQGKKVKIGNVMFRLIDSRGGWLGPNENILYEAFPTAITAQIGDEDLELLFSGDLRMPLGSGYEPGGRVFVRQYDPLPITISCVVPEVSPGGPAG